MVDKVRALELAGKLVLAFPGRNVTDAHAGSWAEVLEPLNDGEASRVVALLVQRCVDPPSVAQMGHTLAEVRGTTMSPDYYGGGWRCVFLDGVECPICHVIHGRLLTHAQQDERWAGLRERSHSLRLCSLCDVVHVKMTHDEYVKQVKDLMRTMAVGKP